MQRIHSIEQIMECKLEKIFLDNITGADSNKLIQCLRTYATIGKHHRAEELFCSRVVSPYMEEVGIRSLYQCCDIIVNDVIINDVTPL